VGTAWVLTLLAWGGAAAGLSLGQSRALSSHLAAAGGGLLFGLALFWLIPEIAVTTGWMAAFGLALAACGALLLLDRGLLHTGHSPRHVLGPLLLATAAHSFLDGWSVRAISGQRLTDVAVPLGLALHKVPEGVAVGWAARKFLPSAWEAAAVSVGVEAVTLIGAFLEPRVDQTGAARFGEWWTATVVAIIAGSFLFLGFHAVLPARRKAGVMAVFVATLLAIGGLAMARRG